MDIAASPREDYLRRLALARADLARLERREEALANVRLTLFVVAIGIAWAAFGGRWLSAWWLLAPVAAFLVPVWLHGRTARGSERAKGLSALYERGLARVEDRWIGLGRDGRRFLDPEHPYAADLDLFGRGSLFQRITWAGTAPGEAMLASWLLAPAEAATIEARQEAVAELKGKLDFREDLARMAGGMGAAVDVGALTEWGEGREAIPLRTARGAAGLLAIFATALVTAWIFAGLDGRLTLLGLALPALFAAILARPCGRILGGVGRRADDLARLESMLERIEREPFASPRLRLLRSALVEGDATASGRIAALGRRVDLLQWQKNLLFGLVAAVWLWGIQVALAIEAWRRESGGKIAGWVAAVAEFEAIASLAALAFESPEDAVPEIVAEAVPLVEAAALGHPLLPLDTCVRNDVALGGDLRVLVISGSNMSGKSTLLRSVGTNVVLALAGGTVRASRMRLSPVAIGATLRIQDSLQEGKSRFYAEILRVKQVVDLARGPLPLLFLLDEIFAGTNSHDRLAGSSAVVRGLIDLGAIGLVTTHDLALAEVAERLAPRASNVHFEDHFADGRMHFDYRMKPGVVRNSNALALMRAVGLEV